MLKELFYKCAFEGDWQVAGKDTDYKFIEENDTLYIFFEGSKQKRDWLFNFLFTKKIYKMFRVHRGFYHCYLQVRSIILDKIYASKDKYKKIIIVGYSHGSSLATICLEDVNYHFKDKEIYGYAFESPRCLKVPKKYRSIWNNLFRIENNWDIVAHLPPMFLGYNNLGNEIKIKGDTSLVKNKLPKCIKSHFQECVMNGLEKFEH